MWFKCNSPLCEGIPVLHRYNETSLLEAELLINANKCRRCRCTGHLELINIDDYPSPYKYQFWDRCHTCGNWRLVSSGTGSCKQCDNPPPPEKYYIDKEGRVL